MSQGARRLRVLHVIPSVSEKRGGPSSVIRNLTAGLAAAGIEVTVATTDDDGEGRSPETVRGFDARVKLHCFPRTTRFYTISLGLWRWLRSHAAEFGVIHIHSLFSFPATVAAGAARRAGVPYVVRPLGTLNRWGIQQRRPWLKRLSFQWIERPLLQRAAWVHFSSALELAEARQLGAFAGSRVIPNPVETTEWRPRAAAPPRILTLGRIHAVKNLNLLIQAFAEVRKVQPEAILEIAGEGDAALTEKLRELSRSLQLENSVVWTGSVFGRSKEAALQRAAVFVLASQSENFGMAAVEAMARGIPVVVTSGTGIQEDVRRTGAGLVCPPTAASLAEAIAALLREPGERGQAGRGLVSEKFSLEAVAATLLKEYRTLAV